jgi:hypothetical protein
MPRIIGRGRPEPPHPWARIIFGSKADCKGDRHVRQGACAYIVVGPKQAGAVTMSVGTAATSMANGGVPRFVISRILNHSEEKDITSVYDRYSYDAAPRSSLGTAY